MRHTLLALTLASGLSLLASPAQAAPLAPEVAQVRELLRNADLDDAIDGADALVKALPNDAMAWLWAGRVYGRQAQEANILTAAKWAGRCRDAFEKAVELDPSLIEARFDLMQFYVMAPGIMGGGRDKAEAQAAKIEELDKASGKVAAANLARSDKDDTKAEALYHEALASDAGSERALFAFNAFLQDKKRYDEARELWTTALQVDAMRAMARYQLGRLAAITGEHLEDGLAYLDGYIEDGQIPEQLSLAAAYWRRGQLLEKLGRREDAIASLEIAVNDRDVGDLAKADLKRVKRG